MRASHRHLSSVFTQFYKHVNPLSSTGLLLMQRQDQVQEINPSYFCVLHNRYHTLITSTNELFILCFVVMLFLNIPQWWQRVFCIFTFCTMYVPKIYKIQENWLELSQSTLENDRCNLIKIISGYADIAYARSILQICLYAAQSIYSLWNYKSTHCKHFSKGNKNLTTFVTDSFLGPFGHSRL